MITPGIDHIALTVPNLDEQVDRLPNAFGMVVARRFELFALIADPASGLRIELARSNDSEVHIRHFGFRTEDVDGAPASLVAAGMESVEQPHPRELLHMYTSYLRQQGGLEVQLVKYDS
jgi:catechol 2,3-dioxygenase-like lactoylglutathione lyase family enzyme